MEAKTADLINPVLPQDVIADILIRLPVKSVGRFRCISKPWRSLLTCPKFIKDHLNFHMNDPEDATLAVGSSDFSPHLLTFTPGSSCDGVSMEVNYTFEERPYIVVSNSCHGLVLLRDELVSSTFLMNPITLEAMLVPLGTVTFYSSLGLAYDSSSDDYKVVSLDPLENSVDIYSVKAKTWRKIGDFSYNIRPVYYDGIELGMYKNACLYWIACDEKTVGISGTVILAFSLTSKELEEVPVPSIVQYNDCDALNIMFLDGCLALMHCSSPGSIDIWMMKEYGVQTSWTKPITISCSDHYGEDCELRVVCQLGEDEIVLENNKSRMMLVAYNWRNGDWRDLIVAGGVCSSAIRRLMPFRGSLLSPN